MGLDAMIFIFWMLSFKATFSLSTFTFMKRLFSSSSLSAIRAMSSAYLLLLLLSRFSHVQLCDHTNRSPPGSSVPGILRQEHWSGLPFPSPVHESEKWKWSHSVVSDSSRPHGLQPTRILHPWDFPGKSTGVGCHCLLHLHIWGYWYFSQQSWFHLVLLPVQHFSWCTLHIS